MPVGAWRAFYVFSTSTHHQQMTFQPNCMKVRAVLCKSNENKFQRNSWLFMASRRNLAWNNVSTKFPQIFMTPTVLIHAIFQMTICFAWWFTPNFWGIIRSSQKVAAIFWTIIHSSRKFDLLFINRPRAFLKHSLLTEIPIWPFQILGTSEAINLLK